MLARFATLFVAISLASTAPAQARFIVDASGGGRFTDLPAAIASTSAGDVLEIRAGTYSTAVLESGRTLVADPNVSFGALTIRNLPAGQNVFVSGGSFSALLLSNCRGFVALESVHCSGGLGIRDCSTVAVHEGAFMHFVPNVPGSTPAVQLQNSTVLWSGAVATGGPAGTFGFSVFGPSSAISASRCVLRFVDAELTGGGGLTLPLSAPIPGAPGLTFFDSDVQISGGRTAILGGAYFLNPPVFPPVQTPIRRPGVFAIGGACEVDSATGLGPGDFAIDNTVAQPTTLSFVPLGAVTVQSAAPGAMLSATLDAPPGSFAGILLSLPAAPLPLPPLGELWLDLPTTLTLAVTIMPASGTQTWQVPLPPTLPRGLALAFQGRVDDGGVVSITLPTVAVIR